MLWARNQPVVRSVPIVVPRANLPRSPYSPWIHGHWVRLHRDRQSSDSVHALIQQYGTNNIPVDVVTLDYGWDDRHRPFVANSSKFVSLCDFVKSMHAQNVKVVLYATAMLEEGTNVFKEAKESGFLVNEGQTVKTDGGQAGLLDYSSPEAVSWWHRLMDRALDCKIDGWKNEAVDAYVRTFSAGSLGVIGKNGFMDQATWSRKYYWDFFDYSRKKTGFDFVTMFRPVDSWRNFRYQPFGPTDISYATWVGDHPATFEGMRESIMNMFHSANKKYLNFGSAVGGTGETYLTKEQHKELFIRWAQLGTFTPIFENGGMGFNHDPWAFDGETVTVYSRVVNIHRELEPFFLSEACEGFLAHRSVIRPIHNDISFADPDTWDFLVGDDIFVAPIIRPHGEITLRNVSFPEGSEWTDWWDPYKVYRPGERLELFVPINHFPVFKRRGTIIPLSIRTDSSDFGSRLSATSLTLLIDQPLIGSGDVTRKVFGEHDSGLMVLYTTRLLLNGNYNLHLTVTAFYRSLIFLIRGVKVVSPESVTVKTSHGTTFEAVSSKKAFYESTQLGRNTLFVHRATVMHCDVMLFYAESGVGGVIDVENLLTLSSEENAHRKLEI